MQFDIYICYARKHLRRGGPIDLALQKSQCFDFLTAGKATTNGQIFPQAMLSFATILFGCQHGNGDIAIQGYTMHGVALKQLNQALSDSKCYTDDEVILSIATLSILECLVPTGQESYLKHMVGLERLLELRGPGSLCSPKSIELYKSVRHLILFASLRTGKPSILARPEWQTVLRANCSDAEMQEQDLFEILAACTVLLAERDNNSTKRGSNLKTDTHQRDEVEQRALNLQRHLHVWKKQWDSDARSSYSESSASFARLEQMQQSGGNVSPPFLTVYEFSNISAAIMLMFYNTTVIYVQRILASVSLPLGNPGIHSNQCSMQANLRDARYSDYLSRQTKYEHVATERSAALEIYRCIPHYMILKSRLDSCSSPIIHWAVTTAWVTLGENESPEGRWITDLLNTRNPEIIAKGLWAV